MLTQERFGATRDGEAVALYTLTNTNGVELRAISFGGIIVSLRVPDRDGRLDDVVLGLDSLTGYEERNDPHFGGIIGRYANRIANGRFSLDGETYGLAVNNGPNHLHGGLKGFDRVVWKGDACDDETGKRVVFSYLSADGEEGYPGALSVRVAYTLTDRNELVVDYHASTDEATHVNLTQHSYFNLAGAGRGDVLGHELMLAASRFVPVDADAIPTGELRSVDDTPFDFRQPREIGARIDEDDEQLVLGGGYDHSYVLDAVAGAPALAARVHEPGTGRVLEVHTTEPGVQLYTANFLDDSLVGKDGHRYRPRSGLCLETQHFPDSPNQPAFPSTILRPDAVYHSRTVFAFSARSR